MKKDPHIEELNLAGDPTVPRPAASVILLRSGDKHSSGELEVLLGRRTDAARFMAGVWVFPGGAVDGGAHIGDPAELVPFARWITPVEVKVRFDTWFFLARAPAHCRPEPDGEEIVDSGWFAPDDALQQSRDGKLLLVFPTIKQLEDLAQFATTDAALEGSAARDVRPILPKVVAGDNGP